MSFRKFITYQKALDLAIEIYEISKTFPLEEKYSMTDQIKRSLRSVWANIGEAFRKCKYTKRFINKLTDSDSENTETQVWLDFAINCSPIDTYSHNLMIES